MLIRNAKIHGYAGLTDLRLMHGEVREIGANLAKGLYESELDVRGDSLRPWCGEALPRPVRRMAKSPYSPGEPIAPGVRQPLVRTDDEGRVTGFVHQHSAD